MNNKVKNAFDCIHTEEQLKRNTLAFLKDKIQQRPKQNHRAGFRRFATALACFLALTFIGIFSCNIYFTEAMYVDVDINPSIELTVNRFDRIIGVYAYNADGEELLVQLNLMHTSYDNAVTLLTESAFEKGFLSDGGLVSVTMQSGSGTGEDIILETLQTNISSAAQGHNASVQVNAFFVDSDIREHAHGQNLSPAKYLAILDLQAVDPTATVEGCRNQTIGEIRKRTEEHGGGLHGRGDGYMTHPDNEETQSEDNGVAPAESSSNRTIGEIRERTEEHGGGLHGEGDGYMAHPDNEETQSEDDDVLPAESSHGNGHYENGHHGNRHE